MLTPFYVGVPKLDKVQLISPATTIKTKLQAVRIFFNTALFDKIERDKDGKMPINQVIDKLVD